MITMVEKSRKLRSFRFLCRILIVNNTLKLNDKKFELFRLNIVFRRFFDSGKGVASSKEAQKNHLSSLFVFALKSKLNGIFFNSYEIEQIIKS